MTSVPFTNWLQTRETLTRVDLNPSTRPTQYKSFGNKGRRYIVYLPKKSIIQAILESHITALAETIQKIEKILSQKLDNPAFNKNTIVIDPHEFIGKHFASVIRPHDHKMIRTITEMTGLNREEMLLSIALGYLLLSQFFHTNGVVTFPVGFKKECIPFWKTSTIRSALGHSYSHFMQCQQEQITFTDHDLMAFNIKRCDIFVKPTDLTCFSFTLLQAKEIRATSIIFKDFLQMRVSKENVLSTLEGWGYQSVETPCERDIVVYFNNNQPTHVGYYTQSGKIHSKLGDSHPKSYLHDLFAIPSIYGKQAVFFRPPQK